VNDESVKLIGWLIADKEPVRKGQPVAEIESSKAVASIESPSDGTLIHACAAGDEIAVGALIGQVATGATAGVELPPSPITEPSVQTTQPVDARFSRSAMELLKHRSVDPSRFAGLTLVRVQDVQDVIDGKQRSTAASKAMPAIGAEVRPAAKIVGALGVPVRTEPLPRTKKVESRYLSASLRHGLPSVVTAMCPTRGLRSAMESLPGAEQNVSAVIIFEVARLLRSFPKFNAWCSEGNVHFYEQVNIGFAVDAEHGLKVPVIRDADTKSLPEITSEVRERVVEYLNDALPVDALAGGTFTVTDLSGEGVFHFHPLINQGQSAILGVGSETFLPGSSEGMFNLILGFDHQISEGREAAKFLNELKRRLAGYESAVTATVPAVTVKHCERCYAAVTELSAWGHFLLQTIGTDGGPHFVCTRCTGGLT
jgi:pyruvate/2-oxoglutarate dehydrogenase complex dihydrolipoamide acyltransferase (E2) component